VDIGTAELAGGGDARVSGRGVASGRSGVSEKGSASERSLSSGRGASGTAATRTGGGDDDGGREARWRFGRKRLSADLEGDGAYIELSVRNMVPTLTSR
jgi:hypothetical protein